MYKITLTDEQMIMIRVAMRHEVIQLEKLNKALKELEAIVTIDEQFRNYKETLKYLDEIPF